MSSAKQNPFLLLLVVAGTCATVMLGGGYLLSRRLPPRPEVPEALKKAEVKEGGDRIEKSLLYEERRLGTISNLRYGEFDARPGPELVVVAEHGADFLAEGKSVRSVRFKDAFTDRVALVDLDGDGHSEFLSRGSWLHAVIVFDGTGAVRWTYEDSSGIDYAAAGDVDGDGRVEVAVGFNGDGGVHLLDAQGKMVWNQPDGNVWHVEMVDLDGDGRSEIVHSNARGVVRIRDAEGKIVREFDPEVYVSDFAMSTCGNESRQPCIVVVCEERIVALAMDGSVLADWPAPGLPDQGDVLSTRIRFSTEKSYHATLVTSSLWSRSVLYLHDSDGTRVFAEVIGEECGALGSTPVEAGEDLLVGCQGKVWRYRPVVTPSAVR